MPGLGEPRFTHDGQFVVVGHLGNDSSLFSVRDADDGETRFNGRCDFYYDVGNATNRVAVLDKEIRAVILRDCATGDEYLRVGLNKDEADAMRGLRFIPNDEWIAAILSIESSIGDELRIWTTNPALQQLVVIRPELGSINSIAFSPDGATVAVAGDGGGSVWHANSGELATKLHGNGETVRSICFSPDGARLVGIEQASIYEGVTLAGWAMSDFGHLTLWETKSGFRVLELPCNRGTSRAEFASDANEIVSSSDYHNLGEEDGKVQIWEGPFQ